MPHDTRKYLRDIELAIGKIRSFLPEEYDFDAYDQDAKRSMPLSGRSPSSARRCIRF